MQCAVARAVDPDAEGAHGASTITMQTAKNLFLWHDRSYLRKAMELPLAMGIDLIWSKRRIMEAYLNIAEFGPGIFGAEAAARHYFGISAAGLSPQQAVMLAAILPSPKRRDPRTPSGYMQDYAGNIRARMAMGVYAACVK
jgi:monofunctional biosynthetic peptidoglycan transglycosylase